VKPRRGKKKAGRQFLQGPTAERGEPKEREMRELK